MKIERSRLVPQEEKHEFCFHWSSIQRAIGFYNSSKDQKYSTVEKVGYLITTDLRAAEWRAWDNYSFRFSSNYWFWRWWFSYRCWIILFSFFCARFEWFVWQLSHQRTLTTHLTLIKVNIAPLQRHPTGIKQPYRRNPPSPFNPLSMQVKWLLLCSNYQIVVC